MKKDISEMPAWARAYLQCFERPAGFDPEGIEAFLNAVLVNWDRQYLIDTMIWMTSKGQKWPERPNGKTLAIAYKKRKYLDNHAPEDRRGKTLEEKLNHLKNALIRAPDHAARWEIICDGIHGNRLWTVEECKLCPLLEAFTLERWPDFRRPQFKPFAQIVHEAAAAIEQGNREEEMTPF